MFKDYIQVHCKCDNVFVRVATYEYNLLHKTSYTNPCLKCGNTRNDFTRNKIYKGKIRKFLDINEYYVDV